MIQELTAVLIFIYCSGLSCIDFYTFAYVLVRSEFFFSNFYPMNFIFPPSGQVTDFDCWF